MDSLFARRTVILVVADFSSQTLEGKTEVEQYI